jgi:peptidyl-tRNA hydrolase, PTH1 family
VKYLIAGLGNIGAEYANTRHNVGFAILDALAGASNVVFKPSRYGDTCEFRYKSGIFILLKPSTYMNLSGNAVRYWLNKHELEPGNLLVLVDDLALPFGKIRVRKNGSDGGHNGLKHINEVLGHQEYARLRFGIGAEQKTFNQIDYVLGEWSHEEQKELPALIKKAADAVISFGMIGIDRTMTQFNAKA